MEELVKDWSVSMNCSFPVATPVVASIGLGLNSETKTSHSYEYETVESGERKACGVIKDKVVNEVEPNSSFWNEVLTEQLCDYLNNGVTGRNNIFSLDENGAINLIKCYGTHIPTQVILGSSCRYELSKSMDMTENSFSISANFAANVSSGKASGASSTKDALDKACLAAAFKFLGGKTPGVSVGFSENTTQSIQNSKTDSKLVYMGGGEFNDSKNWRVDDNVDHWVPLEYSLGQNEGDNLYIPLYELIDKDNLTFGSAALTRYNTLKDVITKIEADGYPKYMHSFGTLPSRSDAKANYVVCDFVYKMDTQPDGQPFMGTVTNKFGESVEVMYYPMRWNDTCSKLNNADAGWTNKTFDALTSAFVSLNRTGGKYQHFYYAMLPETESYGIDAITFVPLDSHEGVISIATLIGTDGKNRGKDYEGDGWTRRAMNGSNSGDGIVGASADQCVPYVHYRDANSTSKAITAVCLCNQDDVVMSSSAGTEYDALNQLSSKRYKEYWQNCSHAWWDTKMCATDYDQWYSYKTIKNCGINQNTYYETNTKCAYSWYRLSWYVNQSNYIYVGYSFRPLQMVEKVNGVNQPVKALLPQKY